MAIAAVGQICSTTSMAHNLEQCVKLVGKAAAAGAKVLFFPEASDYIATSPSESLSLAKPMATSPFVTGLQSAARKHSLCVHVGIHVPVTVQPSAPQTTSPFQTTTDSIKEGTDETPITKLLNRSIWIQSDGTLNPSATYDKLHLFDYPPLLESAITQPGASLVPPFASPIGQIGSLICFDLRFPEASLRLSCPSHFPSSPAQILLYPSAFTVPTGRAHWEVLLRARAIETRCWVIAAAQVGRHAGQGGKRVSYGRSLVVDPWGRVVMRLKGIRGEEEDADTWEAEEGAVGELGIVDVDLGVVEEVRGRMPLVRRT
ncbi:nitrilase and fragile histidine triad fusion protein NitFhit [Pseudomassariella vexata]|uniref:Nitrilase and fragile histidine triad fusion protein NitFhit n=1 Tax=Pseudomassariella vexata TaxID=1141098 RepID=A0A1Y2DCQ8_9PEZI|nr:nitrilase and fragile histidine triad fusion protein NitFhit [Pseudomassariella vexata]ORY56924.1 nitrilase and fragile histidine triad fusion protein NitFhit [Pseudomassariella vexata]